MVYNNFRRLSSYTNLLFTYIDGRCGESHKSPTATKKQVIHVLTLTLKHQIMVHMTFQSILKHYLQLAA